MSKRVGVVLALCIIVSACAGTIYSLHQAAGIGVVEEKKSTFDGATIVKMSPAFLHEETWTGVPIMLGAQWNSKAPNHVAMILSYSSSVSSGRPYMNFSGLDVNIDGKISEYKTSGLTRHDSSSYNTVTKTIYTESENAVLIPLATLQEMMQAKDCRLRIHTSEGYADALFSIERSFDGRSTAILHLSKEIA
jgi:hypothetical protein